MPWKQRQKLKYGRAALVAPGYGLNPRQRFEQELVDRDRAYRSPRVLDTALKVGRNACVDYCYLASGVCSNPGHMH